MDQYSVLIKINIHSVLKTHSSYHDLFYQIYNKTGQFIHFHIDDRMAFPIWKPVEINISGRPQLLEDEIELLIEDSVGLYQGKSKILDRQNGRVYLTSKRIIFVDNIDAKRNSVCIELVDVDQLEFYPGFLKSSPKISIYFKDEISESKTNLNGNNQDNHLIKKEWICSICSYNNSVKPSYDPSSEEIPACASCGIKPPKSKLLSQLNSKPSHQSLPPHSANNSSSNQSNSYQCPRCTFINHPSMINCELCDNPLTALNIPPALKSPNTLLANQHSHININLETEDGIKDKFYIKLSFHGRGEKKFWEMCNEQLTKTKWESLVSKGKVNSNSYQIRPTSSNQLTISTTNNLLDRTNTPSNDSSIGLNRLEQIEENKRRQNEMILSSSLEDLEQLMNRAKDLLKLSSTFTKQILTSQKLTLDNLTLLKNSNLILGNLNKNNVSSELYYTELSRIIYEYLSFITKSSNGVVPLIEFYAMFNRSKLMNLISPEELVHCLSHKFPELKFPYVLKTYRSGVVVIIRSDSNERDILDKIISFIKNREAEFENKRRKYDELIRMGYDDDDVGQYVDIVYKGESLWDISENFGWSFEVTQEEIDLGISETKIVIDQQISGTFYFINKIEGYDWELYDKSGGDYERGSQTISSTPDMDVFKGHETYEQTEIKNSLMDLQDLKF